MSKYISQPQSENEEAQEFTYVGATIGTDGSTTHVFLDKNSGRWTSYGFRKQPYDEMVIWDDSDSKIRWARIKQVKEEIKQEPEPKTEQEQYMDLIRRVWLGEYEELCSMWGKYDMGEE